MNRQTYKTCSDKIFHMAKQISLHKNYFILMLRFIKFTEKVLLPSNKLTNNKTISKIMFMY